MSSTNRDFAASEPGNWASAGLSYHSLNFFYRNKFGERVAKISLDAGCGCPNRDGTLATLGCIFCDPESFSPSRRMGRLPLSEQLRQGKQRVARR
jgi:radical SAM superfamily enzyme